MQEKRSITVINPAVCSNGHEESKMERRLENGGGLFGYAGI